MAVKGEKENARLPAFSERRAVSEAFFNRIAAVPMHICSLVEEFS